MEFLRFGSSIPGTNYGCCCVDIIQGFSKDPDEKASIQLVTGDSAGPIFASSDNNRELAFAGPTYRDIFNTRIRIGTHGKMDMPNHGFLAVMTETQLSSDNGKKWLAILKEAGFEFIRAIDNSVYTGNNVEKEERISPHPNYLFGLFRNIGPGAIENPYKPPSAWTELPTVVPEAWTALEKSWGTHDYGSTEELTGLVTETQLRLWKESGSTKILSETEVKKSGAPVIMAGQRSYFPPQTREDRQKTEDHLAKGGKVTVRAGRNTVVYLNPLPVQKAAAPPQT